MQLVLSHLTLLVGCLWGGLPYVVLQALLSAELILLCLASIALYPERGVAKHVWDMVKLCGMLAFVMLFVLITYGAVAEPDNPQPLSVAAQVFRAIDAGTVYWAFTYAGAHIALALWSAWQSSEPRLIWARENLGTGAVNWLAMVVMIMVAIFIAKPVLNVFASIGIAIDADVLLASLMVLVRFLLSLVLATLSETDLKDVANQPYAT